MAEFSDMRSTTDRQSNRYHMTQFPGGLRYPTVNYDNWERETFTQSIMNADWIKKSVDLVKTWGSGHDFGACYVIGLKGLDKCKIGFSTNPAKRLMQFRVGLWEEPVFHAIFWSFADAAMLVEFEALALAKRKKSRLKGEWVDLSPVAATDVVVEAIWKRIAVSDSENFYHEWVPGVILPPDPRRVATSVSGFYEWAESKRS